MDNKKETTACRELPQHTVYASQLGAALDSDISTGGGTDDTDILQAFLDTAPEKGGIHLIMDGAALIRGLRIHSNTTIECMNKSCGFFLADNSDCAIVTNYHLNFKEIIDHDITLIGGVYNQNCKNQVHDCDYTEKEGEDLDNFTFKFENHDWNHCFKIHGIRHFTMRDVTIRNQRTFGALIANFEYVTMENIIIDLPDKMWAQNQDGLHFWGPGRFLNLRNITGDVGDDFIALAPDEHDHVSDLTDVLIDGVVFNHADQGIRMLSRGKGRLDRVFINNVTGTYRSFGFYVNPWFPDETIGNFGHITINGCDVRQEKPCYEYTEAFLFQIGGHVENLTVRDITIHDPIDTRPIMKIGYPFHELLKPGTFAKYNDVGTILIDGLHIEQKNEESSQSDFIRVDCPVECLSIRNANAIKAKGVSEGGSLVKVGEEGKIDVLITENIVTRGLKVLDSDSEKTKNHIQNNVNIIK